LDFSVPDKGYSRHVSCALILISRYLFIHCKRRRDNCFRRPHIPFYGLS